MNTRFLYLFLLLFSFSASAQPESILNKPLTARKKAIDSLLQSVKRLDPAGRTKELEALEEWAGKHDDDELVYVFHMYNLKQNCYLVSDDKYRTKFVEDLHKAERKGYKQVAISGYDILSSCLWEEKQYSASIEYGLKCYSLYKDIPIAQLVERVDYQHSLAIKYLVFRNYAKAKEILLELCNASNKPLYDILGGAKYNTVALVYLKLEQFDSALYAFNKIYTEEERNKDYGLMAIAAGNLGSVYYELKDYDNAIKWLQIEFYVSETFKKGHINLNIAHSSLLLAELYTIKNMPGKALAAMQTAKDYIAISGKVNNSTKKSYYKALAKVMAAQGNMGLAYKYLDSSMIFSDSVKAEFDKSKLMEAEFKIDKINHDLQLQALEHNRETSIFIRNTAIIIITLLSVIGLLFINRSRLRYKQKELLLQKEKEKAEIDLNSARTQLSQFTKNIHEKNKLIDRFTQEIDKLQHREHDEERNETLNLLQQSTILTDEEWDEFRVLFEKVHSGFLNRLKEKYTEITPAETRYLALTKLNLSNKEMANMLGTGTTAVRNYKYRLRKKLDLPDDDSFDEMIQSI